MKYPTVSVNGVSVRVDGAGRYNLNDLHAARDRAADEVQLYLPGIA